MRENLQLRVSATTVRWRLNAGGIHHEVPAIKERLTEEHRAARFAFAQEHVGKDLEFWSNVIFTDEKTFASTNHGRLHMWRPNNTRYYAPSVFYCCFQKIDTVDIYTDTE